MARFEVTLVRHLPTEWNMQGRLQGRRDIPIAAYFEQMASLVDSIMYELGDTPFDVVYVSTLRRTQQTATLLGFSTVEELSELDEYDLGFWEGKLLSELHQFMGGAWFYAPDEVPMGEPFKSLVARVKKFIAKICNEPVSSVLVIGHGVWIRCFLALIDHNDARMMNTFKLANGEVVKRYHER